MTRSRPFLNSPMRFRWRFFVSAVLVAGCSDAPTTVYKERDAPTLMLIDAPQASTRSERTVPNALESVAIEVGVTNISHAVVRGVEVIHLYNAQTDVSEPYRINASLRPRSAPSDQYRVSIDPGETAYFKFGDYVILEGDVRYIQFPFDHMRLRPGWGPDQGGFPYVYRVGLQVSGENVPATEAVFRLTMFEQGYSFIREEAETHR